MPIATCLVSDHTEALDPHDVVAAWRADSGVGSDEMTVNLLRVEQGGKAYAVMAWLHLPSSWDERSVVALQEGLASALAATANVSRSAVLVVTAALASGTVVEDGRTVRW